MSSNPKLTVYKAINKSFIVWGIPVKDKIRVYYKNELEKRTKPCVPPFIVVDYDANKREWYINYINDKMYSCTINDITGSTSMQIF